MHISETQRPLPPLPVTTAVAVHQALTLFTTPVVFLFFDHRAAPPERQAAE